MASVRSTSGVVLFVGLELLLDQRGARQQVGVLVGGEVGKLQVVFQGGHTSLSSSGQAGLAPGA